MADPLTIADAFHDALCNVSHHDSREIYRYSQGGTQPCRVKYDRIAAALRSGEEEPPPDLRAAAVAVDALWDDPDPSDPDAADDLIWMTHDEEAMRDALRSLREALRDTRAATTTSRRGRRAGWPVVREQTFGRGTRQEMTLMVVEPPISENEIRGRQHWLDGHRAGKAGTELTCCGLIEAAHPTYPTASGHEFGLHHWLLRGCAACAVTITTLTGRSLTPATEEPK